MEYDFGSLGPRVYQILMAPGTDMKTISAKVVRRQLLELDSTLTPQFMKSNKDEVDAIIGSVFEQVSREQGTEGTSESGSMEATMEDEDNAMDITPPPEKPKKATKKGRELSDAELARRLSSEINGRSTRTGSRRGNSSSSVGRRGARSKKSSAIAISDDENEEGLGSSQKKSPSLSKARGGFQKEFALSEPLAALIQADKLSRPQVVKQLWVYIKENELQNPLNKREILCDRSFRAVFGVDKIDMFRMNKVLGQHLHEIE